MRVRCFYPSLLISLLLLPLAVHAGPKLVKDRTEIKDRTDTRQVADTEQAADSRQVLELPPASPHGKFYNQCSGQQFVMKSLGTLDVFDGGLGGGKNSSFFCGPLDELSFYGSTRKEMEEARTVSFSIPVPENMDEGEKGDPTSIFDSLSPNRPDHDQAPYSFFEIRDNCREAGFGNVKPDNRRVVIGIPEGPMSFHPRGSSGNLKFRDIATLLGTSAPSGTDRYGNRRSSRIALDDGLDASEEDAARALLDDDFLLDRNRIASDNFSYGRYLIRMVPADSLPEKISENSSLSLMGLKYETLSDQYWYKQESLPPYFLDIPYDETRREWMSCGLYSGVMHPDADPGRPKKGEAEKKGGDSVTRLDPDRLEHYRDLHDVVLASLGNEIRDGEFFPYPPAKEAGSVEERLARELVGNIYFLLAQFSPTVRRDDENCALTMDQDCWERARERLRSEETDRFRNDRVVPIFSCSARSIVEYQPEKHRICIDPPVASDCLSQKTKGSDSHHNVEHCDASYGHFDETHGLVDEEITLPRGYELYADTVGGGEGHIFSQYQVLKLRRQPSVDALLPVVGYSPVIVAKIIHHRIHAFSCEKLGQCLHKLEGPARDLQERLATVAESLAYTTLCRAGYCDYDFGPQSRDVITAVGEDPSGDITGITVAREFFFQDSCRGFGGIALGPYCTDMFNMTRIVESGDAELAGVMAQFYSNLGEIEKPLPLKQLSGNVREEGAP